MVAMICDRVVRWGISRVASRVAVEPLNWGGMNWGGMTGTGMTGTRRRMYRLFGCIAYS